ncbi:universal stress protein [Anaerotalea alkaliphila]|uniref:Universal stress protein n=1 Tax=Anaerotalea alkaliphila TaxID=2662126 RepID=A0A7X5HT82_9FIRM|nr:universal stress protein [Anaerotalea alkaliphila]NDL66204.1 universal stress protein [Anaerotalea alkaliphila]
MFKRVVIATDLSPQADALVNCMGNMREFGMEECLLVQCLHTMESYVDVILSMKTHLLKNLKAQENVLKGMGYRVESRLVVGSPRVELNKIAEKEEYDLIVVGAEKQSLTGGSPLSTNAYELLHHMAKPVLLVRMAEEEREEGSKTWSIGCGLEGPILFPTDFSVNAGQAFQYLQEMVRRGAKKITLLHVQDEGRIYPYLVEQLVDFNETDRQRLEEMKETLLSHGDAEVETMLVYGYPNGEIPKAIQEKGAGLVVMGSQGRGVLSEFLLGSVSQNIARHGNASVLLIPVHQEG